MSRTVASDDRDAKEKFSLPGPGFDIACQCEGNGDVIHFSSDPDEEGKFDFQVSTKTTRNSVRKDKLRKVAGDSNTYRNNEFNDELRPYSKDEIVKRAYQRLRRTDYNLVTSNCEHFATECRYGVAKSKQVETVLMPSPVRAWNRGDVTELLAPPVKWVADKMFRTHPGDLVRWQ